MLPKKNFYGKVGEKTIYDFSCNLDYRLKQEKRLELIDKLINPNGKLDPYFEEVFTQKFDIKRDKDECEILKEELEQEIEGIDYTGANISKVKLIVNKNDTLYSDTNVAKELEKMADYILFAPDREKDKETKIRIYTDEDMFKRMATEPLRLQEIELSKTDNKTSDDKEEVLNVLVEKDKNFKKEKKQKLFKSDLEIPTIQNYQKAINFITERLQLIKKIEGIFGRTYGFKQLELLNDGDKALVREHGEAILTRELYRELQKIKPLLIKNKRSMQIDQIDIKDSIKGTIYFKQPLSDSTEYDWDCLDFGNDKHLLALLGLGGGEDFQEDKGCIQYDLRMLVKKTRLTKEEKEILTYYKMGLTIESIGDKFGKTRQALEQNLDTIVNKIKRTYDNLYEDWYYTFVEKGTYKTCNKCKKNKLVSNFSKASHRKDGLNSTCRDCLNKKKEKVID